MNKISQKIASINTCCFDPLALIAEDNKSRIDNR